MSFKIKSIATFDCPVPVLAPGEKTIVFVQKKRVATQVTRFIHENTGPKSSNGKQIWADAIHGDRSQSQREAALGSFKRGEIDVLGKT